MRTTFQTWCAACGEWEGWGRGQESTQTAGEVTAYMLVRPEHVWSSWQPFATEASATSDGRYLVEHVGAS